MHRASMSKDTFLHTKPSCFHSTYSMLEQLNKGSTTDSGAACIISLVQFGDDAKCFTESGGGPPQQ